MSEQPPDEPNLNSRADDELPQEPAGSREPTFLPGAFLSPDNLPPPGRWWHVAGQDAYKELQDKYGELKLTYEQLSQAQGSSDYVKLKQRYRRQVREYGDLLEPLLEAEAYYPFILPFSAGCRRPAGNRGVGATKI
jgi:hypothetical protein